MTDVIISELTWQQKVDVGEAVAKRLEEKRPEDRVAVGQATELKQYSNDVRQHSGARPVARDARGELVDESKGADNFRDRAISAVYKQIEAWELRDDKPEKQRDASLVETELLPKGPKAITELGYVEQTAEMKTLLQNAAKKGVADAIGRLKIEDFIDNIRTRQAEFENVAGAKGDAHLAGTGATRSAAAAARCWDATMRSIVNRLDSIYEGRPADQRAERDYILQPLADANAVARMRMTRAKAPATPPDGDPKP